VNNSTVILFNHNGMGQAEPALAHKLAGTYLELLDLDDRLPRTICFYAEGVKLAVKNSPVLDELATLAQRGVELLVCTTCLNHFELLDDLAVGKAGSMKDIIEAQDAGAKVITL
jgi:intracellular sulfur oxidation DsrE/DsrF family protein